MTYSHHNSSDSIPPEQRKRLTMLLSLYTYLNQTFLTDRFISLKEDTRQDTEILLSNLNWSQLQRSAAYMGMLNSLFRAHDVKELLTDKALPKQLRLLLFVLLTVNHKFDYSQSRSLKRVYKKAIYQSIKHLPLQLAYEIAVSSLPVRVNNYKRLRALYGRSDLNYLTFAHSVNNWQNFVRDKLSLWQIESYYRLAQRFLNKMNHKKHYRLVYVFSHGLIATFPEVKGFKGIDLWRVNRINRTWEALANKARVKYLEINNLPTNPEELPEDWLKEIAELPDLEALLPVGIWNAKNHSMQFLEQI